MTEFLSSERFLEESKEYNLNNIDKEVRYLKNELDKYKISNKEVANKVIFILNNLTQKNNLTEVEELPYGGEYIEINPTVKKILNLVKDIIRDSKIDNNDLKKIDILTQLFHSLKDNLDNITDNLDRKNKKFRKQLKDGIEHSASFVEIGTTSAQLFPEIYGDLSKEDVLKIFDNHLPTTPEEFVYGLEKYLKKNMHYDFLSVSFSTPSLVGYLNKIINSYPEIKQYYINALENIMSDFGEEGKLKKELIEGIKKGSVDSTNLINFIKKYPNRAQQIGVEIGNMLYDNHNIKDLLSKIHLGVCRDVAAIAPKILHKVQEYSPQLDINTDMLYVADSQMAHAYNIMIVKENNHIKGYLVDFTPVIYGEKVLLTEISYNNAENIPYGLGVVINGLKRNNLISPKDNIVDILNKISNPSDKTIKIESLYNDKNFNQITNGKSIFIKKY